jgi:hypothetical protein
MRPGAEPLLCHGSFEKPLTFRRQIAVCPDLARAHLGVAVDFVSSKAVKLGLAGAHHALANMG